MDKTICLESKKRFLRGFEKKVGKSGFFRRMGYGGKGEYAGKLSGDFFFLYRDRKSLATLFALTARGTLVRESGRDVIRLRFGRCIPLAVLWVLWCALMLFAGVLTVVSDTLFSLWFIVPALLCALPLFLHSKKEKARLTEFVRALAE